MSTIYASVKDVMFFNDMEHSLMQNNMTMNRLYMVTPQTTSGSANGQQTMLTRAYMPQWNVQWIVTSNHIDKNMYFTGPNIVRKQKDPLWRNSKKN